MSATYEDTVFDFDLNFLNQTTTNTEPDAQTKNEKLRRSVIFLKKKVLFSHKAVSRYKIARKYANILENNQVFNKEGCKQHLIEIRNLIEDVARLENQQRAAESREKEKNEIIYDLQNKLEALQSHEKQLKLLLKEKNKLEPVRPEKNKDISNFKDRPRKGLLQKENDALNKENERLKKEIESLRKGNNKILHVEKEHEIGCNENSKILSLEKEIENLLKELDEAKNLKKTNEYLRKENARIPNLDKANKTLRKETARITNLEKENKILRKENAKITNLEKEIETLRKENAKIESLEKVNRTLHKENTKIQNLEKEMKMLNTHLALVKKEKSKLRLKCHQLLRKYESVPDGNEWVDNSNTETDIFEDSFLTPPATDPVMAKKSQIAAKEMATLDFDNDNSNEVVSIDTGRGSSLDNSDNEKCLHSPDYFENDSLLNEENIGNKETSDDVVSMTKSTNPFEDTVETATNPVSIHIENEDCNNIESLFLREVNPKLPTIERTVSPIKETREVVPVPVRVSDNDLPIQVPDLQAKECLELNNSINLQCESYTDLEIEKILSRMQLNYNAMSPIPKTPAMLRALDSATGLSEDTNILRLLGRVDILEEELTEVKKALNEEIEERLRKSNQSSTLQFGNVTLADRSEYAVTTQDLLKESNPKISHVIISEDDNVQIISNRLSIEINNLQNKKSKNKPSQISLPKLQDQNLKQLPSQDHSVFEELTTDQQTPKYTDTDTCPNNHKELELNQSPTKDATNTRKYKSRKITKLEKLKKKLEPKYKIRRATPPLRSRIKPKQLATKIKRKVTLDASTASLNDKNAYENAVKVMAEINLQQNNNVAKSPPKHIQVPLSPKSTTNIEKQNNTIEFNQISQNDSITTRSKRKYAESLDNCSVGISKEPLVKLPASVIDTPIIDTPVINTPVTVTSVTSNDKEDIEISDEQPSRKRRRRSINKPEIQCKRILRSSTAQSRLSTENNTELSDQSGESNRKSIECHNASNNENSAMRSPIVDVSTQENGPQCQRLDQDHSNVISYDDLNVFVEDKETPGPVEETSNLSTCHPKESILCNMIEKYGVEIVRPFAKKVPDKTVMFVCEKLEQEIAKVIEVPTHETKNAMNILVADLRKLNYKHFITGLMKYLTKPERKTELFGKVNSPPAPPMTKAEQVLLYVISHLKTHWPSVDIVDAVLSNIEYIIFKLNRTPEFDVIESTSHFYALLCRYFGARSRLRLFILDAMYCIQFKSLPLIRQCLDVWMHIIPLAHMGIAKSPLVTCLVYLLHFYKCDDKFNRIQDIRNILHRKYFYKITDWNEKRILEMFKISIMELKDIPIERKMLRLALIILAKRQGPRWCQINIIKNLLQPLIEKETVPNNVKEFCVSMFGPLMRPYPVDMKVHCEIVVNQLTNILNNEPSQQMEEAAITSLMFINRHDQLRINQTLLSRRMKTMSPELEKLIRDYVRTKPVKMWKKTLSRMT